MSNQTGNQPNQYTVLNLDRGITLADRVVIAGTSASRKKGLLGVDGLADGAGLWIAPCEAVHTFGMKIPIDVAFLDRELRVYKLVSSLRPWRIAFALPACSVLELQAGALSRSNTKPGDRLRFQPLSPH